MKLELNLYYIYLLTIPENYFRCWNRHKIYTYPKIKVNIPVTKKTDFGIRKEKKNGLISRVVGG